MGSRDEDFGYPASSSEELLSQLEDKARNNARYATMQEYRKRLPAWGLQEAIVDAVRRHQVRGMAVIMRRRGRGSEEVGG